MDSMWPPGTIWRRSLNICGGVSKVRPHTSAP
jgi:hypothetical protein